jgi:tetratricopeptide (TPR) repeat protein
VAPALVEGLQIHFDRLQPQRADLVRQIVRTCLETRNQSVADTDPQSIGTPETVESLLRQADQTADKKMKRPEYLARAARLAAQQKNFELAIKILESMNEEERKFINIWGTWRRDWAAALAIEFIKRDDAYGMQQVIKAVPDALQAFAKIYFVDMLPKNSSLQIARDFLDESRKDLAKAEMPDLDKAYWYLMVVRLYSKSHLNGDAIEALKDAIGSLNRVKSEETNDSDGLSELNKRLIQGDFPVSLLESNEYAMKEAVSSIASVPRRVRLRLDLLEFSIAEYRAKAAKFTPEQKASRKSQ